MSNVTMQVKVCVDPNSFKFLRCVDDKVNVEFCVLFSGVKIPLLTV